MKFIGILFLASSDPPLLQAAQYDLVSEVYTNYACNRRGVCRFSNKGGLIPCSHHASCEGCSRNHIFELASSRGGFPPLDSTPPILDLRTEAVGIFPQHTSLIFPRPDLSSLSSYSATFRRPSSVVGFFPRLPKEFSFFPPFLLVF